MSIIHIIVSYQNQTKKALSSTMKNTRSQI